MTAFWESKSLEAMSASEWESLCDGCGQCCMIKLQDDDSGEVHHTAMVCDWLDIDACRCTDYANRHFNVPDCVPFDARKALEFSWLPKTCAYRTLAEGRPLPAWHPLISGTPDSVVAAGISVRDRVIPYAAVHPQDYDTMIVKWVDL